MANLVQHMPIYYKNSIVASYITKPIDLEINKSYNLVQDYVNQFIVSTATFALDRYEKQYGLPINPQGITIEERRSRIKAKMRSIGAVNKSMLQNVVNAWTNGDIEVIEDYNNYKITIKFVNIIGIPSNMQDVHNAISEIIPAHITVTYEFKYNKWSDIQNKTWQDVSRYTWGQIYEGNII